MIPWAHLSPQPKWHIDRLSHYWSAQCCDRSTDRPTTLSVKELTTPNVKNNAFTLGMVGQYTLIETVELYQLRLSVFTH